jgi:YfiH family protein
MSDPKPNDPFQWTQEPWGRALLCTALPVRHFFTSADVQLRDDEREWAMVAASLGVSGEHLRLIKQVHGTHVAIARRGDRQPWARPQADSVLTDDPAVAVGVRVADCAPILLYDRRRHVAGAVHAGWRGTAAQAAPAAVRAMRDTFGTAPADLIAAIGPSLGRCCGEVGPDVIEAFRGGGADERSIAAWFAPGAGDRAFLDLERANRDQLERSGLDSNAVFAAGTCTKTHHRRLHSYRAARDGAGRMLAAIRCRPG